MRRGAKLGVLLSGASLILVTACASTGTSRPPGTSRSVLTADELRQNPQPDLLAAIQALRPVWLGRRATNNQAGDIVVYLDNMRLGGPGTLRSINPTTVGAVHYFTPVEAQARYGIGHHHGAILVRSGS